MGTNRYASRFLVPTLALACLLPLFSGCRKKVRAPVVVPVQSSPRLPVDTAPPAITPATTTPPEPAPAEPAIAPKVSAALSSLSLGEVNFQAGNYARAARSFEDYLKKNPESPNRDMVLFRLGLSIALAESSGRTMRRAEEVLKRLVAEFPQSPFKSPAEFILGLQSQVESLKADIKEKEARIKLLSEELQKLKEIDLQRRPSRPSY